MVWVGGVAIGFGFRNRRWWLGAFSQLGVGVGGGGRRGSGVLGLKLSGSGRRGEGAVLGGMCCAGVRELRTRVSVEGEGMVIAGREKG